MSISYAEARQNERDELMKELDLTPEELDEYLHERKSYWADHRDQNPDIYN